MAKAIKSLNWEDIVKTQEALKQGRDLILKRQKLIKLADSDVCWDVVQEYLSNELASNSNDKKHSVFLQSHSSQMKND